MRSVPAPTESKARIVGKRKAQTARATSVSQCCHAITTVRITKIQGFSALIVGYVTANVIELSFFLTAFAVSVI